MLPGISRWTWFPVLLSGFQPFNMERLFHDWQRKSGYAEHRLCIYWFHDANAEGLSRLHMHANIFTSVCPTCTSVRGKLPTLLAHIRRMKLMDFMWVLSHRGSSQSSISACEWYLRTCLSEQTRLCVAAGDFLTVGSDRSWDQVALLDVPRWEALKRGDAGKVRGTNCLKCLKI